MYSLYRKCIHLVYLRLGHNHDTYFCQNRNEPCQFSPFRRKLISRDPVHVDAQINSAGEPECRPSTPFQPGAIELSIDRILRCGPQDSVVADESKISIKVRLDRLEPAFYCC